MRASSHTTILLFALAFSVALCDTSKRIPYPQLQKCEANPKSVLSAGLGGKKDVVQILDGWVEAMNLDLDDSKALEHIISSPFGTVRRKKMFKWFKANEASFFLTYFIKGFFLDSNGKQRLSDGLIEKIVDEVDECSKGYFAAELKPEMTADGQKFATTVSWIGVACSDRKRIELILYQATRQGTFLGSNPMNNLIPSYLRSWLLKDMNDYFHGQSVTC